MSEIARAYELQRRRKFWIGVETKLAKSFQSYVRGALGAFAGDEAVNAEAGRIVAAVMAGKAVDHEIGDLIASDALAFRTAIAPAQEARAVIELDMKKTARRLPAYAFVKSVKGFGDLAFCMLVGEAGDLGAYDRHDKLWKRLGLSPHDGKAYSTWRSAGGLTADQWVAAGYAPRRRAEVFAVIQEPLFRHQTASQGPYRAAYDARRAQTVLTHPDWTPLHAHRDAGRVMVQKLVRHLWAEWRRAMRAVPLEALGRLPAASIIHAEARP